jgi:hypothetical protein
VAGTRYGSCPGARNWKPGIPAASDCMTAMLEVINNATDRKQVTRYTIWDADSIALVPWVSLAAGYLLQPRPGGEAPNRSQAHRHFLPDCAPTPCSIQHVVSSVVNVRRLCHWPFITVSRFHHSKLSLSLSSAAVSLAQRPSKTTVSVAAK